MDVKEVDFMEVVAAKDEVEAATEVLFNLEVDEDMSLPLPSPPCMKMRLSFHVVFPPNSSSTPKFSMLSEETANSSSRLAGINRPETVGGSPPLTNREEAEEEEAETPPPPERPGGGTKALAPPPTGPPPLPCNH